MAANSRAISSGGSCRCSCSDGAASGELRGLLRRPQIGERHAPHRVAAWSGRQSTPGNAKAKRTMDNAPAPLPSCSATRFDLRPIRRLPANSEHAYYPRLLFPQDRNGRTTMTFHRMIFAGLAAGCFVLKAGLAFAAGQYGPGASDTEIKIGNTMPYSGPASTYGTIGKSEAAYFAMINEQGGINGRKINFISRDDGYSPPKTVEQVRRLVEQDQVLPLFNTFGTPPNTAIQGYLNDNKVPQLFVATGANKWNDPKHYPWTIGWPAQLPDRGAHLGPLHPQERPRRQDRACSIRTTISARTTSPACAKGSATRRTG